MSARVLRILQICPRIPYPLHDGRALSIFNITKHLALRGHRVHMATFDIGETPTFDELRQYCELTTLPHDLKNRWQGALLNLPSRVPYNMAKYRAPEMFRKLEEIVVRDQFDVVHVDHVHMAIYGAFLKEKFGVPIVIREHNFEATIMARFAENQKNLVLRAYAHLQYRRLLRYEADMCSRFDRCVMITAEDERRLLSVSPQARTTVIPAGVQLPVLPDRAAETPHNILFLASLDWRPNVEGFLWFYQQILPMVLQQEPKAKVTVVGKGAAPELEQLSHPNVNFVGFAHDLSEYFARAQVCIVPLLTGGGMRLKILEMFAHGKCVVATPVGCEGIAVQDGRELLVAERAETFAQQVLRALQTPGLRASLGANARTLVETRYDWRQIAADFEQVYWEVSK